MTKNYYKVEKDALRRFPDRVIIYEGKIAHTDKLGSGNEAGLKTCADWWMLTETDINIIRYIYIN